MGRPIESQLYRALVDSRFHFLTRGTIEINEIYEAVHNELHNLCDDEYPCAHQKNIGLHQAEWKHIVRSAMQRCKKICDDIEFSGRRGYWIFT